MTTSTARRSSLRIAAHRFRLDRLSKRPWIAAFGEFYSPWTCHLQVITYSLVTLGVIWNFKVEPPFSKSLKFSIAITAKGKMVLAKPYLSGRWLVGIRGIILGRKNRSAACSVNPTKAHSWNHGSNCQQELTLPSCRGISFTKSRLLGGRLWPLDIVGS